MNDTKFTPGPWTHDAMFPNCVWANGVWVASTNVETITSLEERAANARLIAAVPEMYAYLAKMRDKMNCVCDLNKIMAPLGAGVECQICAVSAILARAVNP